MIKLTIGKSLEQRKAQCNFCGEPNKDCVKGGLSVKSNFLSLKNDSLELKWLKEGTFSTERLYWIIKPQYEIIKQENDAYICEDCIKQLAKLI